jgi:hypothetical protein
MRTIVKTIIKGVFECIGVMIVLFVQMGIVVSFINMVIS